MMSRVTRRIAVWLLSTESFGLESTRTSPNCSSSLSVTVMPLPIDRKPSVKGPVLKVGLKAAKPACDAVTERNWPGLLTRCHSMPRCARHAAGARLKCARRRGGARRRDDLVGLAQDLLQVLYDRFPEIVLRRDIDGRGGAGGGRAAGLRAAELGRSSRLHLHDTRG